MARATFNTSVVPEIKVIFIHDLDGEVSVTNDAEAVVKDMTKHHDGYRIFYRDTMGQWDELLYANKEFTGYGFLSDEERVYYKDYLT